MKQNWPKIIPALTLEQQAISNDFMKHWHEVLPKHFGIINRFNHGYPVAHAPKHFLRTLEIGAGLGEHLAYEKLTAEQRSNYITLDIRENMIEEIKQRFPDIQARIGDCQTQLDFPEGHFDRILAIHVLEHLPNLPNAIREMHRLCNKTCGVFSVVIPCEGSVAYTLARRLSAQKIFEKRYQQPYQWFIEREHINKPIEIFHELTQYFTITHRRYFPLGVPLFFCNLCIGLSLKPRNDH